MVVEQVLHQQIRGEGGLFDFVYALLALFRIWVIYLNVISPIKDARSK